MPISKFLQQFLNGGTKNRLFGGMGATPNRKKRRSQLATKATRVEVCEERALLAAAMTSSSINSINDAKAELAPADAAGKVGKFIIDSRWTRTATNGSGLVQGDPTTLTWSFPADGVPTDEFDNADAPNNLLNFLNTTFPGGSGSDLTQRPWFQIFDKSLNRLEELAGLTYNFVTQDDGVPMRGGNFGILGTRADIRIMGKNIDDPFNTLAYNALPEYGDMTIDTTETSFFSNSADDYRAFRNTLMHEFMHGVGIEHVESAAANFLIEPVIETSFDGPQLDDILALQRSYGDTLEKGTGNDTIATATNLGTVTTFVGMGMLGDSTSVSPTEKDFVSIDDESDRDFYKFTVGAAGSVTINVTPRGATYNVGPEGGAQAPFNSKSQGNLAVKLLGEDGVTVLQTQNVGGLGAGELISSFMLSSPGTYFVEVSSATADKIQLYGVDVFFDRTPGGQIHGIVFNDNNSNGSQGAGETGIPSTRVFIDANSNGTFDNSETSVMTDTNGNYAFVGLLNAGTYRIRAELPGGRTISSPQSGFHDVNLPFDEVIVDINFGSPVSPVGTSGNDAFVLTYSATNVTVTMSTNGGAATTVGTFPLTTPLTIDGAGGTDSVRFAGTTGVDEFYVAAANVIFTNNHSVTLTSVEQRTLAGGVGNDEYIFDTDAALGLFTLDESGGGTDLLDFFLSDLAVTIDLGISTSQVVNANLSLILGAVNAFENVEGGAGLDKLYGNALNNLLSGNGGNDDLEGRAGNDTLRGGDLNDLYLFDADTQLGEDIIEETAGLDLLDFRPTVANIAIDLAATVQQTVNSNLKLTLNTALAMDDVRSGAGNDTIKGNSLANHLYGGGGNDSLIGLVGDDKLSGEAGNDRYIFDVDSQLGSDKIVEVASEGTDELVFTESVIAVVVNLDYAFEQTVNSNLKLTLEAPGNFENVRGGSGDDTLRGNALANLLVGDLGNDVLLGGSGADTLIGSNGNDFLQGQTGSDILEGSGGDDRYVFENVTVQENDAVREIAGGGTDVLDFTAVTANLTLSLSVLTSQPAHSFRGLTLTGASAIENVSSGSGNDTLTGNPLNNTLRSGSGNDRLMGVGGNDELSGGSGNDLYHFLPATSLEIDSIVETTDVGIDTLSFADIENAVTISLNTTTRQLVHTNRGMTIRGNLENIIGGRGNDKLTGNSLANTLTGNNGNDVLEGLDGSDSLVGSAGNDTYKFTTAATAQVDTLLEAAASGTDTIDFGAINTDSMLSLSSFDTQAVHTNRSLLLKGAAQYENVIGGEGNDVLIGNGQANRIAGGPGRDILVGGDGSDTLMGGDRDDILIGGFVFFQAASSVPISFTEFYSKVRIVWTALDRNYSQRVTDVGIPRPAGPEKFVYLAEAPRTFFGVPIGQTVFDDKVRDQLIGDEGIDLFFSAPLDVTSALSFGEIQKQIAAIP